MPVLAESLFDRFAGQRILVTGHTGFKGSWLSYWIAELGAELCGYALPPAPEENLFGALSLASRMTSTLADIRDGDRLAAVVRDFQPTIVFHLAAQSIVRRSFDDPLETFSTNAMGGANLLEAVRRTESVRALVYVTSDKCYENKNWVWGYRETDELGGHDPYSASKAAAEIIFSAYSRSFFAHRDGFGAASVRAGNVIGGGDWSADRLLPDCSRALREGREIVIRNPEATRPWQFVLDPLSGYMVLALRLLDGPDDYSSPWNFGPGDGAVRTVRQVTDRAVAQWGSGGVRHVPEPNYSKNEAQLLQLSIEKARLLLDWSATYDVDTAVDQTIAWYRRVAEGERPVDVTADQLADFVAAGVAGDRWR
jgi:CDP-glucose 4,6-dehydratase